MKLAVFVSLLAIMPFQARAALCVGRNVEVTVTNGESLSGDGILNPDPYVVVTIGDDTQKTKTVHGESNPTWSERFMFYHVTSGVIKIEIWDSDGVSNDDHLGTCMEELMADNQQSHQIQCNADDSGYVNLIYKCY